MRACPRSISDIGEVRCQSEHSLFTLLPSSKRSRRPYHQTMEQINSLGWDSSINPQHPIEFCTKDSNISTTIQVCSAFTQQTTPYLIRLEKDHDLHFPVTLIPLSQLCLPQNVGDSNLVLTSSACSLVRCTMWSVAFYCCWFLCVPDDDRDK